MGPNDNLMQTKMDCYRQLYMLRAAINAVNPEDEEIKRIDGMLENLKSRQYIVGVVGEFNRGKSSLINALLGSNILPADIIPTTATVNRVIYSDSEYVRIVMRDGHIEENIPISELKSRVTKITKDSESAAELVKEAVIGYPTVLCQNNVSILDTPGLNESPAMDELTFEQMDTVDALIFALRIDYWFSDSEAKEVCRLLELSNIRHILFTVGFIDKAREEGGDIDLDLADIRRDIIKKTFRIIDKDPNLSPDEAVRRKSMIKNAAVMGISAKDALESFLNGSQQQRKDSRIAEYKTELMARLTAQVDEWLIYEVLPYLKKQDTVYHNAANRNIAETGMGIQLASEQIADSLADLRMLPDKLTEAKEIWEDVIRKTLGDKNELRESLKNQMITEIDSRSTGNDKEINKATFFGKLKSWGKEQGFYRDENDEETKNIRLAYEIVKNRILHIAEDVNYNAGMEYEKIENMIRICDQTSVENIHKAACELSIDTPQAFSEVLASFSAFLQDFMKQQSESENPDPEIMKEFSNRYFLGQSSPFILSQISAIQEFSKQEGVFLPEHLAEMISGDLLFLRDEELSALGNLQSGFINIGSIEDLCFSKTYDLVEKLFELAEKRIKDIGTMITIKPETMKRTGQIYLGTLSYELEKQEKKYNQQQDEIRKIKKQFSL